MRLDLHATLQHLEKKNLDAASATSGARKVYPGSCYGAAPAHRGEAAKSRSYTQEELKPYEDDRGFTHALADRNLPELQMASAPGQTVGSLVLGLGGAGKTSLIHTMAACIDGRYPKKHGEPPALGQPYAPIPVGTRELVLTDTRACGPREEQKLTADIHPNSMRAFNAIPQWLRLALRQRDHSGIIVVLDATRPLWEDFKLAEHLARLISVLIANGYKVALAATKILLLRNGCLAHARGATLGGALAPSFAALTKDTLQLEPTSCYETFVWRYLQRVQATLRTCAERMRYPLPPDYPRIGTMLLDVPTFRNSGDVKEWQDKRATRELPNLSYAVRQLGQLAAALVGGGEEATARRLDFERPHILLPGEERAPR